MSDREVLTAALGAAMADLRCLDLVFRHGPLHAGRLARMLGLTPGSVTALVDRLVRAGYVQRTPDPTHGRRVLIVPTERAARTVTELLRERLAEAHAELADFTDAELDAIVRFVRSAADRHERAATRLRGAT
jgi:DNA-binding MarR family transcriptional regulator